MTQENATVAEAPHAHFVQFYKADEPSLNRNVASFLWDGLLRGDGLVVIATPQRRESLSSHLARLGADVTLARREGQLAMLDAQETLGRFMVDGQPHWERFQTVIAEALKLAVPRVADARVCAYGEMVGLLWEAGQTTAAIQLEELWNRFLHRSGITLFCGYPIDVFANDFHQNHIHDVLRAHSHLMPTGSNGDLREALDQAMDELLGDRASEVRLSMKAGISAVNPGVPEAESSILWLRSHVPESAETILASARRLYEASLGLGSEGHSAAA
jgi:KaiC/GvpD/RAD55 family RecA-like ATPase